MNDHIDTAQERNWLDNLPRNVDSLSDLRSFAEKWLNALDAERARAEKAEAMLDHTQQWYAERVRKIEDVAKREGLWPEIAAILANGSATRQMPDGSSLYDPPTYAQQLNIAKHRAEKAETERDRALARLAAAYEAADICALTPADAEAALQRVVDAAWNEAVEAAAKIVNGTAKYHMSDPDDIEAVHLTATEIRSLKRPEASHE